MQDGFIIITQFDGRLCLSEVVSTTLDDAVSHLDGACSERSKLIGVYHLEGKNRWDETSKAVRLWADKSRENASSEDREWAELNRISSFIPHNSEALQRTVHYAFGTRF